MSNSSPKIDQEKIKHIAHLSRIGISDEQAQKYATQMESILDYMKILEEVKTDGVEMTTQVTGLKSVTRPDDARMCATTTNIGDIVFNIFVCWVRNIFE